MILIDSSVWIDFLRNRDERTSSAFEHAVSEGAATTEPVILEVLAGARGDQDATRLQAVLAHPTLLRCEMNEYVHAAAIYRATSRIGLTVRRMSDCLIAAVAIRESVPVLHRDRDFDVIAQVSDLQLVTP